MNFHSVEGNKCKMKKNKVLRARIDNKLFNLLKNESEEIGMLMSDLIRFKCNRRLNKKTINMLKEAWKEQNEY